MCSQRVTVCLSRLTHTQTYPEYIVTFNSYYTTEARDGFISATLRPFSNWALIPRSNPVQQFPSDFSLVQLGGTSVTEALHALSQHPYVKRVTPQKRLTRMLTFSGQGQSVRHCNSCVASFPGSFLSVTDSAENGAGWEGGCEQIESCAWMKVIFHLCMRLLSS